MTDVSPGGSTRFQALCRTLLNLDVPEGRRAEIIAGHIVMSPWSQPFYLPLMRSLRRQLEPHAPEGHIADSAPFLFTFPSEERAYGPDVYVVAERALQRRGRYVDGEALSLVAELTSPSTRDTDWDDKAPVYGRSGVPVYLLLDMQEGAVTVFWNPSSRGYAARLTVPFGEKVTVPAPFDCVLDTTGFDAHPDNGDSDEDE
ncbi:Uma2 family endonuclease [Streptomyces daliensis]|uniref:Uma2 family endonuclease n=1 Tax=Streptomyces daliensis TaxID=299421 RepID=A0A8T4IRX0_9ACTN|nr:Uma2 family endonuclease [Streptomyces daliensis]